MNAERLHAIAIAIDKDLGQTSAAQDLKQLSDALQNQVNDPPNASHQQTVSETLQKMGESLRNAGSNQFSPAWLQNLEELGGRSLLGGPLLATIQGIFERNQITPSVALEEIKALQERVERFSESVRALISSLRQLNIGTEELAPGDIEIEVLVPRAVVRNRLDLFARELVVLEKTFGVFSELAIGSRPSFQIRTFSSSELTIVFASAPAVAAAIALAVERVITTYKRLLEIRLLRSQIASQGVPDQSLQGIDTHADSVMESGVDAIIVSLEEKYASNMDGARGNELRTELRGALYKIANRVDKGYNFEVRVQPLEEPSEEPEDAERQELITTILESAKGLEYLKLGGNPILSLDEPEDERLMGPEDDSQIETEDGEAR